MKKFLILICLILQIAIVLAQDSENWASARGCKNENSYSVLVSVSEAITTVILNPIAEESTIVWNPNGASTKAFNVSLENEWVEVLVFVDSGHWPIDAVIFEDIEDCVGTPYIFVEPLNECLGISPESVDLPNEGVFTVDNRDYAYNGNLSFLVPQDAIWQWDLFHEGNHVLSFAQSEDSPCGIVGG